MAQGFTAGVDNGLLMGLQLERAAEGGSVNTMRLCLDELQGTDVNTVREQCGNALVVAGINGHAEIARLLLDRGADVNHMLSVSTRVRGSNPGTALIGAVINGHAESAQLLLDRGADVNIVGREHGTALTAAVEKGQENMNMVQLLLKAGADVNTEGGQHGTTLIAAAKKGYESIVKLLLKARANVNVAGWKHGTALIVAAEKGHESIVELLLKAGADVNVVEGQHSTALIMAAEKGHELTVELLLKAGVDMNIVGRQHGTALIVAVEKGHESTVELLLKAGADVNVAGGQYGTALIVAVEKGHESTVKLLLKAGADVNVVGGPHGTALTVAAEKGYESIVKLLLKARADVNVVGWKHGTALIVASEKGHESTVELLLKAGVDVNTVGWPYGTALAAAAEAGHESIVELLLKAGADVDIRGGQQGTALIAATWKGHADIVRLLVGGGADVNIGSGQHGTALIAAVKTGHNIDMVQLLLGAGADVNIIEEQHGTALIAAVKTGHNIDMVQLLLTAGADVNIIGGRHGTALTAAVEKGQENMNMVQLLLKAGADVNIVGGQHGTALITAADNGHVDIARLLLDGGANVNQVYVRKVAWDLGRARRRTALIAAAINGHAKAAQLLLDRGADVNFVGWPHGTALTAAVETGQENMNMVQLLLKAGADVDIVGGQHGTALIVATDKGCADIVRLLLDGGADVNMINMTTALIAATGSGRADIVQLLVERGADLNSVERQHGTALIAAVKTGHSIDMVQLLLAAGADVNIIGGQHGTALIAATESGRADIVRLLLDGGADVNININLTTALIAATENRRVDIVRLLVDRGADVNIVGGQHGTALMAAAEKGYESIVEFLLQAGADVNAEGGQHGTALMAATEISYEHIRMHTIKLLLKAGADVNIAGGQHGTALIAAICTREPALLSVLLDCNPDISIVAGVYGTALIAAICELEFREQSASEWQWTFLNQLLSANTLGDHINVAVGDHGTVLTTAISKGNVQLLRLLVGRGADVNRLGGRYRTMIGAALAADLEPSQLYSILQYLLGEGADINAVNSQEDGSALGQATYKGDTALVSFLLDRGADPFHVGGTYNRITLAGAYPNALDAARSSGSKAGPDLIALLSNAMKCSAKDSIPRRCPPFPMPFTKSGLMRVHNGRKRKRNLLQTPTATMLPILGATSQQRPATALWTNMVAGTHNPLLRGVLTAQQANIPCTALEEAVFVQMLVKLVIGIDTDTPEFARYEDWIRNDARYFVAHDYDFGEAYAAARVGWKHFYKPEFIHLVAHHRGHWLRTAREIDEERIKSIYQDNTGQEMINRPYEVMPRRLWDLKSNRVVEFRMLHSELLADKCTTEGQLGKERAKASHPSETPAYWAITHSWESSMDSVVTPINQYQWQVPLPRGLDIEHNVRQELLNNGIAYVWLDVLCLRQHNTSTSTDRNPLNTSISEGSLSEVKEEEWKLDVPTIGNIYRKAQGIVRYFNGLGRPFSTEGWDGCRHWLRRAWTLQEIKNENSTINGGIPRGTGSTRSTANIMNAWGTVAGEAITLRRALRPVLKLAADVDSSSGCSLYGLAREMSQRVATQATDKVAGLAYLLHLSQLPTYSDKVSDEDAWTSCFHMLPLGRKIELLFDFPYRSDKQQWFPTWSELLAWPEIDPDCDYNPAGAAAHTEGRMRLEKQDLEDLTDSEHLTNEASLFMPDIWALSSCHITHRSAQAGDYDVTVKDNLFGFYCPYASQKPISITSPAGQIHEFAIATADLGHSKNWVICEVVKTLETRCKSTPSIFGSKEMRKSGMPDQNSRLLKIEVLRKVGVLRTDFCAEITGGGGTSGDSSVLQRINALFV